MVYDLWLGVEGLGIGESGSGSGLKGFVLEFQGTARGHFDRTTCTYRFVHRALSSLLGPVDLSFRWTRTVRRHKFNKDSLSLASLGWRDYPQVDMLGLRCDYTNFEAEKGPMSPSW